MEIKRWISLMVTFCLTVTTVVCQVFYASTANAMEYTRAYIYYVYDTGVSNRYFLYGQSEASADYVTMSTDIDDRARDTENTAVVRLSIGGTGFIVDDHTIATAAHCLYDTKTKSFVKNMTIQIYTDDNFETPYVTIKPKSAHINYLFAYSENRFWYDYGLLYVEEDLSQYGEFALGVASDEFMELNKKITDPEKQIMVKTSGFPGEINGDNKNRVRYYASGKIENMEEHIPGSSDYQIAYDIFSSGGQSGGPVYFETKFQGVTYKTVIGIHTTKGGRAYGTRITSDVLNFYYNNSYINVG